MKYYILLFAPVGFLLSCGQANLKTKLDKIYLEATQIQCDLNNLRDSITVSWNIVNETLDQNLPNEIPQEERTNILKVRNASLIRMFETYQMLDESTKQKVDNAEKIDQEIAQKISTYKKRLLVLENERQRFLHLYKQSNETLNFENYPTLSNLKPLDCS